ncbi:DUF421 domain-containing protein [Amphibacillus sp. MSJ-3]|uniref:DUF421 domain-containing protein n=1 Tax=Amphibacillus sp. MSJ-3 TaxID=2841505 RepID=UPI001C0F1AED|nr:DUF421 domain-containing protein [Amphibacillus sp. MSJ-3]MBU5595197.1 DUF421 domain-containing protein [Amphibacillus sp. MSJ-3]
MEYGYIFIETIYGFIALFIITKVLGKTQIRQLTAFDFISALLLGELVGNALYDENVSILHMSLAVITWGGLMYLTEFVTQRFKGSRSLIEGKPSIIINKGELDREVMKKSKLDVNQLQHLLRLKDVFSFREVEFAILENDGTVSVLKKSACQSPNRHDLNLKDKEVVLPITLVNDGEIIHDNLAEIKRDQEWLEQQIKHQNVKSIEDIFYAEYQEKEPLHIQLR